MKGRKLFPFFFLVAVAFASSEMADLMEFVKKLKRLRVESQQQHQQAAVAKVEKRIDDLQRINSVRPIELRIQEAEEKLLGLAKLPELVSQLEAQLETVIQLEARNILPLSEKLSEIHKKLSICLDIDDAVGKLKGRASKNEIQNDVMSLRQKNEDLEKLIQNEVAVLKQKDQNVEKQLHNFNEQLKSNQIHIHGIATKMKQVEDIVSRHDSLINSSVTAQNKNIADRLTDLESDTLIGKRDRVILYDKIEQVTGELRQNVAETKSQNTRLSSLNADHLNLSVALKNLKAQHQFFNAVRFKTERNMLWKNDVIVEPSKNRTALHVAAIYGNVEEVRELLRNGSNIEVVDFKKSRPLHLATWQGEIGVIRELLDNGAEVNVMDVYGYTPLHWAVHLSKENYVDLLLSKGANIDAKDIYGETSLHKACYVQERIEIVELLVKRGANINCLRNGRATPLHVAVQNGRLDIVKFLVEKGADVNAKIFDGRTAIDIADVDKHQDIINYLKLHI